MNVKRVLSLATAALPEMTARRCDVVGAVRQCAIGLHDVTRHAETHVATLRRDAIPRQTNGVAKMMNTMRLIWAIET